jgi:hypothetical protein
VRAWSGRHAYPGRPGGRRRVPAALASAGRTRRRAARWVHRRRGRAQGGSDHYEEVSMAKKARKKKARKKSGANHGKRPNS